MIEKGGRRTQEARLKKNPCVEWHPGASEVKEYEKTMFLHYDKP